MRPLKPYERRLAAHLLEVASDEFANHGCNDLDLYELGLTTEELEELHVAMAEWNNAPADRAHGWIASDWFVMSYLANLLVPEEES